jgi:hypothetical protein
MPFKPVEQVYFSVTPDVAMTTSYPATGGRLGYDSSIPKSQELREQMYLSLITLRMTGLAGGPTTVDWFLAADANGDAPITPVKTSTIVDPDADGEGAVSETLEIYWPLTMGDGSGGGGGNDIYVFAKLDAGTATNSQAHMSWVVFTDSTLQ